jgi:hypothetical protein
MDSLGDTGPQLLTDQLRKRKEVNSVALTIAGAILAAAIASAANIEQSFWAKAGEPGKLCQAARRAGSSGQ